MSNRKRRKAVSDWAAKTAADAAFAQSGATAAEGTPERAAWDAAVEKTRRNALGATSEEQP